MDIAKSIFNLANSNNGFFKSEKQAIFLIDQMTMRGGCIGQSDSGYNSCPIFAKWDDKGILEITKSGKRGDTLMFQRKVEGKLTDVEKKQLNKLKRELKKREKEYEEKNISFQNGNYNGSGDPLTYTADMIDTFNVMNERRIKGIEYIKEEIDKIKLHEKTS